MDGFCRLKTIKYDNSMQYNCYKVDNQYIAVKALTYQCLENKPVASNVELNYVLEDFCYNQTSSNFFNISSLLIQNELKYFCTGVKNFECIGPDEMTGTTEV